MCKRGPEGEEDKEVMLGGVRVFQRTIHLKMRRGKEC